jgi:hypothetical protein
MKSSPQIVNTNLQFIIDDLNVLDKIALAFGYSSGFKRKCYEHTIVTAKDWTWYFIQKFFKFIFDIIKDVLRHFQNKQIKIHTNIILKK